VNVRETITGWPQGWKIVFRALKYRNFRLFYLGQIVSLTGTWMQQVALGWLVYQMTQSAFLLGIVGFLSQMPIFLISPFAGVISDRFNKRRILLLMQILFMLQALLLAALVLTENIAVWHIIALSLFAGIVNAVEIPARQSYIIQLIDKREDLLNAIALNSAMFNGTRFIGPSVAGILIALTGEGICFLVNGVSYAAPIAALLMMDIAFVRCEIADFNIIRELKEGLSYSFRHKIIKRILILLSLTSMMGTSFMVLLPAYAKDILQGGPHTLGFLMSAVGAGAVTGAIYLASRSSIGILKTLIPLAAGVFGAGLIGLSVFHFSLLPYLLLFAIGLAMMMQVAASNTVLQTTADDNKRGRVIGFFAVAVIGMSAIGSLLMGFLAGLIGMEATLLTGGLCCIAGAVVYLRRRSPKDAGHIQLKSPS